MITSPFATAHKLDSGLQTHGKAPGQGSTTAERPALTTLPPPDAPGARAAASGLDFEALLHQTLPDDAILQSGCKGPIAGSGHDIGDAALADLETELRALLAHLVSDPGETTDIDTVTEFLGILHQFDLETGADGTGMLHARLEHMDEQGRALLENAALDPVALVATLAQLADIPEQIVQAALPLRSVAPALLPMHMSSNALSVQIGGVREAVSALAETPTLSGPPATVRGGIPAAFDRVGQADTRGLVLSVIAQNTSASERDGQFLSAPTAESRPASGSFADALRPMAAPSQAAPAIGFARNLIQQIRTASLSEGQTRIALAPRGLGEIEIDLRPDEAGRLRIVLRAENPAVLQALRSDRDGLLTVLSESGAATEDADLEFEDFSRRSSREAEETAEAPFGAADPEAEDPPQVNPSPLQQGLADGALDILT